MIKGIIQGTGKLFQGLKRFLMKINDRKNDVNNMSTHTEPL